MGELGSLDAFLNFDDGGDDKKEVDTSKRRARGRTFSASTMDSQPSGLESLSPKSLRDSRRTVSQNDNKRRVSLMSASRSAPVLGRKTSVQGSNLESTAKSASRSRRQSMRSYMSPSKPKPAVPKPDFTQISSDDLHELMLTSQVPDAWCDEIIQVLLDREIDAITNGDKIADEVQDADVPDLQSNSVDNLEGELDQDPIEVPTDDQVAAAKARFKLHAERFQKKLLPPLASGKMLTANTAKSVLRLINIPLFSIIKVSSVIESFLVGKAHKVVEVSTNGFMPSGFDAFASALVHSEECLKLISVSQNPRLGSGAGTSIAKCLGAGRLGWPSLKYIRIESCGLADMGVTALVDAILGLGNSFQLHGLKLSRNRIGSKGAESLGKLLKGSSSLVELDLSWNSIGEGGGKDLAVGVRAAKSLRSLNLAFNRCKDAAASIVTAICSKGSCIERIDLSSNGISAACAATFGKPLLSYFLRASSAPEKNLPALKQLILRGNDGVGRATLFPPARPPSRPRSRPKSKNKGAAADKKRRAEAKQRAEAVLDI